MTEPPILHADTPPLQLEDVPLRPFWRRAASMAPCSPAAAAFLAQQLTVVVNTSPCSAHPSTRMLEETCASLALAPGLAACRLLLVFDGFKLRDRLRVKRGAVTPDVAAAYERYAARVELLTRTPGSALEGAHVLRLAEHHGCAHALRRGLARTHTPYVLVVQHGARRAAAQAPDPSRQLTPPPAARARPCSADRALCSYVDVEALVRVLHAAPDINYIGAPRRQRRRPLASRLPPPRLA